MRQSYKNYDINGCVIVYNIYSMIELYRHYFTTSRDRRLIVLRFKSHKDLREGFKTGRYAIDILID